MLSSLIGHHGPSGSVCFLAFLLLLLASQVCAREMKSFEPLKLDEKIEKLFCGTTGHICMHKRPSNLRPITGPRSPHSIHAEPALNIAFPEIDASSLDSTSAQEGTIKSDNTMIIG